MRVQAALSRKPARIGEPGACMRRLPGWVAGAVAIDRGAAQRTHFAPFAPERNRRGLVNDIRLRGDEIEFTLSMTLDGSCKSCLLRFLR
jgi:hypothetical protein